MYDNEAFDDEHLADLLDAHNCVPDYIVRRDVRDRLVELAEQRADTRADSALDDEEIDCLIITDWTGYAEGEFGYDGGNLNQVAFGVFNEEVSRTKNADLFTDVQVVQDTYLTTGDGRKTKLATYEDEDYDNADEGELWMPDGASDYIAVFALSNELLHDSPQTADAM